jgi:hypothetical protein
MQKHKITIFFLILYYAWFAYVGWHMITGTDNEAEGLRLATMIIISVVLAEFICVCSCSKCLLQKNRGRRTFFFYG